MQRSFCPFYLLIKMKVDALSKITILNKRFFFCKYLAGQRMVVPSEGFDISNAGSCLGLAAQGRNFAIPEVSSCMPLLAACFRVVGKVAERYRSDVTLRFFHIDFFCARNFLSRVFLRFRRESVTKSATLLFGFLKSFFE